MTQSAPALLPDYEEDTITVEAAGMRLTLFVQKIPKKVLDATPEEIRKRITLMNLVLAFQNLRRRGKVGG